MAIKSLSQLQTDINTDITGNGVGGITGPELNAILIDSTDSFVHVDFTTFTNLGASVSSSDIVVVNDSSDSGNIKYTTVGDLGGLFGGGGTIQPSDANTYNIRATNEGSVSGNPRGERSVDLQTARTNASGVAAANYSSIINGSGNVINSTATHSTIMNGVDNQILNISTYGTIAGGKDNRIGIDDHSEYSFIGGGRLNDIHQDRWNVIVGGSENVLGNVSIGIGSFIGAGRLNEIGGGDFNFIGCGFRNKVSASGNHDLNTIAGGRDGIIPYGAYNFIGGGDDNKISHGGFGNANTIGGGYNNQVYRGGHNVVAGGYNNTVYANYSNVVGGGRRNRIGEYNQTHSRYSTIAGGEVNRIGFSDAGEWGFIGGGSNNRIDQGKFHTVGGGRLNRIYGTTTDAYSTIGGGYKNRATGSYQSILGGFGAYARRFGESCRAAGFFGTLDPNIGNAQWGSVIAREETTTSGFVEMFLDDSSERLVLEEDSTLGINGSIIGRRTDGGGDASAYYTIEALIDRDTATTTTNLIWSNVTTKHEDNSNWDVSISADTGNGAFKIEVAGDTSQTVQWVAYLNYVETRDKS
jgi:hypothetical protein